MGVDLAVDTSNVLSLSFGGYSIAGRKPENQDAFAAFQPNIGTRHLKGSVACIADGVSCSENSQKASQTSVTQFIEDYLSTPDTWPVKTAAARVLSSMSAWLFSQGQSSYLPHNGLVTTFSSLVCKSTTAHIFHVGDSRVYRVREGECVLLTRDHTHNQGGDQGYLVRALGMDSRLEVDYYQESLQEGDVFVLTTDGVHEYLKYAEFADFIKRGESEGFALEGVAKGFVDTAFERGSEDNLSCLVVKIDSLPTEEIDEVHRQLTALKIPPVMEVGNVIDGYEILDVLHSGSRSHLYVVCEKGTHKTFVLKAPSENFADDPVYLEGFIREQWVGRRINNPRVMKIYERPENSPFLYHLCENIKGRTLQQWMYDNPQPSIQAVRNIIKSIVDALRVFQRQGMSHRDLKPDNIMLDERGQVKLIDFGTVLVQGLQEIQSVIDDEVPVGTVDYVAPETVMGQYHAMSDLFSLGVIAYEMLTGKLPFKENLANRLPKHFSDWTYRSSINSRNDIPQWLDLCLQKATEPDPRKRYHAFSEFLHDFSVPNASLISKQKQAPFIERNPLLFWKIVSGALAALVVVQTIYINFN